MSALPKAILRTGWGVMGLFLALFGQDTAVAQTTPSGKITADLRYEEPNFTVYGWGETINETKPFKTEPKGLSSKVTRSQINFKVPSGSPQAPSRLIQVPFLWDQGNAKFYIDANLNGNLTDDTSYSALKPSSDSYQTFSPIHLSLRDGTNLFEQSLEVYIYSYSGNRAGISVSTRSCWLGRVTLQGTDWQVGILEGGAGAGFGNGGNEYLLLRPWTENTKPFNANDDSASCVSLNSKNNLFFGKQAYHLDCRYVPGTPPKYQVEFTPVQVKLGELEIAGKHLSRLILQQRSGDRFLVVLDKPEGKIQIPVGLYQRLKVSNSGNTQARVQALNRGLGSEADSIGVTEGKTAIFKTGEPLTNTVTIVQRGDRLRFSFSIVGAGGELYGPTDRSNPPRWTVYRGEKQIASGKFEFG